MVFGCISSQHATDGCCMAEPPFLKHAEVTTLGRNLRLTWIVEDTALQVRPIGGGPKPSPVEEARQDHKNQTVACSPEVAEEFSTCFREREPGEKWGRDHVASVLRGYGVDLPPL
jgi:hypothetical protein